MQYDNFSAVDSGFANIAGTMVTDTNAPLQYVFRLITNCFDAYTLFDRSINEIAPIPTGIFSGSINAMSLRNRYLFIMGRVRVPLTPSTSLLATIPTYTMNDLNTMQSNFKIRLRPLAIAYANNPTTTNLTNLQNQINLLNAPLAPKGLEFNMQIGGF
jgi:hypothetical protein